MANAGQPFELNLLRTLDVDKVRKDIYPFGDQTAPHNKNTGIERNGGVQNIFTKESVYPETGYHYLTEDGHVLSAEAIAGNARLIRVDNRAVGQVSSYGVESRTEIEGYDDVALTADGTYIAVRVVNTTVTITELSLANVVLNTRSVTFANLSGLAPYFSSLSIIRYQPMHYVDSQEFALRMGFTVVILKESTPSQIVSLGIGGNNLSLFPAGGSIAAIGKYKNFLIFGSGNGLIASFDGQHFKASDGSGIGTGPFNNQTVVGTNSICAITQFDPAVGVSYLVICGRVAATSGRVGSWDGLAWKNYDGTGTGGGPFDNNTAIAADIIGSATYLTRYFVIFGQSGRVASWDHVGAAWKLYNGTGTGAGPFDNGTAIGANTINAGIEFSGRFAVGGNGGRIGSWLSGTWTVYTAGTGLSNNATVVSTSDVLSFGILGSFLFVGSGSNAGRLGTWDGTNWKNYNGTGTGTGPSSNAAVVGAGNIVKFTNLGTTLVVNGSTGNRYGSWDGTNFKNYDGTGTGTGIFGTTTFLIDLGSVSYDYLGRCMVVFAGSTVFNYIDSENNIGPLFTRLVGGLRWSQLLLNTDTAGYLFFYRFEEGSYYTIIEGNTTNKAWLINTSMQFTDYSARYAIPQVSSNKTRMLVVKTPEIVSALIEAFYFVGYTDFVTFTITATLPPNDTTNTNAININSTGPVIGYNYVDVLYRTTASGTDIRELYLPNPTPTPIQFWRLLQSNTSTNINGYGKLNNMLGAATAKPFEFRTVIVNGEQVALSVAMIDGLATDALGVLITNVGEWDNTYLPQIVNDDTILYRFNGKFFIVKIGTNIPNFFDKITSDLYKLNTIHPSNLYSDRDRLLYVSSVDYHGQAFFTSTAAPASTAQLVANVINTPYSNSIDVGDKLVLINPVTQANIEVFGARLPSNYGVQPAYAIDGYINDEYAFSTLSNGIEIVDPAKDGLLYLPDTRVPVAIGADYQGSVAIINGVTIILFPDYDGYLIGNDLQGSFVAFILFGQTYLFDGNFVYLADIQSNVLVSSTKTAPANGLTFIAESPTEIYFLSDFDNSIFTFTGGRSLAKSQRFTATTQIQQGAYSVRDNTLLLETVDSLLFVRDSIVTQITKDADQTNLRLFYTTDGLILSNDVQSWQYTYDEIAGSTPYPLTLKTAFFGANSNIWSIVRDVVIVIYDAQKRRKTVTITYDGYDDHRQYTQTKKLIVEPIMYTQNGFARIRMQPESQRVLGAAIQYYSEDFALIQEIDLVYEQGQQQTIAPNRSM